MGDPLALPLEHGLMTLGEFGEAVQPARIPLRVSPPFHLFLIALYIDIELGHIYTTQDRV